MRPVGLDSHCPRMTPVVCSPRRDAPRVSLDVRVGLEYLRTPAVPTAHALLFPRSRDVVVVPAASHFAGGHAEVSNHAAPYPIQIHKRLDQVPRLFGVSRQTQTVSPNLLRCLPQQLQCQILGKASQVARR